MGHVHTSITADNCCVLLPSSGFPYFSVQTFGRISVLRHDNPWQIVSCYLVLQNNQVCLHIASSLLFLSIWQSYGSFWEYPVTKKYLHCRSEHVDSFLLWTDSLWRWHSSFLALLCCLAALGLFVCTNIVCNCPWAMSIGVSLLV